MKKLVFGLIAMVVFGNVSYGQEFKSLYEDYKKSLSVFYSKLDEFDKKLKVDVDEGVFKSEETFKEWLEGNISKTEYQAPEDALKDYNEQINLMTEIIKNNADFLMQIKENNEYFLNLLSDSPLVANPITSYTQPGNTTQGCVNDCINGAVFCGRNADSAYADTMIASGVAFWTGNTIGAGVLAWTGSRTHRRAMRACRLTFDTCADGC